MTVAELIERLKTMPPEARVVVYNREAEHEEAEDVECKDRRCYLDEHGRVNHFAWHSQGTTTVLTCVVIS